MPEPARIAVSVVYADPTRAFLVDIALPLGATVADAIAASGIREQRPEVVISAERLAIFARKASPDAVLRDGDRVEILRPLKMDPKDARRQRAGRMRPRNAS